MSNESKTCDECSMEAVKTYNIRGYEVNLCLRHDQSGKVASKAADLGVHPNEVELRDDEI